MSESHQWFLPISTDSPGEVTGTGGERLHDFGGMGAPHTGDKRRGTLLRHLVFIA